MEAHEFVKKFGLFVSKEYLAGATIYEDNLMVFTNGRVLERIIESYKLIDRFDGLQIAKDSYRKFFKEGQEEFYSTTLTELKVAIEDVEKCL